MIINRLADYVAFKPDTVGFDEYLWWETKNNIFQYEIYIFQYY